MDQDTPLTTRRNFVAGGIALGAAASLTQSAHAADDAPTLKSRFLFSFEAVLEPPQDLGERKIYVVKSGTIEGPRIKGVVLPGGGDWSQSRSNGSTMLDVRGTIKTDDDQLIYTWYRGIVAQKDSGLYFRTTPYFETASEKYAWLNNVVAVGVFKPVPGKVAYNIFEIL